MYILFADHTEVLLLYKYHCLTGCKWSVYLRDCFLCVVARTAMVFSLIPPTGKTFPVSESSPVMATFCLIGRSLANEMRAETMVTPALGPSLGVAPCDQCALIIGCGK